MQGGGSKPEVFYGEALVEKLFEGGDTDLEVVVDEFLVHLLVALGGFHALWNHGLVGDEEEGAGGDFVEKPGHENRGGLHIDGQDADFFKVFLERLVVFPDAAVGGVHRAGPIIALVVPDGGGNGLLQAERRQRRHLRRKVVGGGALAADGRDGQDQVAQLVLLLEPAAGLHKFHTHFLTCPRGLVLLQSFHAPGDPFVLWLFPQIWQQ